MVPPMNCSAHLASPFSCAQGYGLDPDPDDVRLETRKTCSSAIETTCFFSVRFVMTRMSYATARPPIPRSFVKASSRDIYRHRRTCRHGQRFSGLIHLFHPLKCEVVTAFGTAVSEDASAPFSKLRSTTKSNCRTLATGKQNLDDKHAHSSYA